MGKAVAVYLIGLALLFILSITWGRQVFATARRTWFQESRIEPGKTTDQYGFTKQEARLRSARFAFSSFDLVGGLTINDMENITHRPGDRYFSFLYLVACLWLVWGLRRSRSPS